MLEPNVDVCPKDELPNIFIAGFSKAEFESRERYCPTADAGVRYTDGAICPKDLRALLPVARVGAEEAPKRLEPEEVPSACANGVAED